MTLTTRLCGRRRNAQRGRAVNAVVQSQKLGVALGDLVRIQASEIRRRRRQAAEEKAVQASLKMIFPMIGCIFPTLFMVLMGPVLLILVTRK